MRVLIAASEAIPFVKTGGLGDVAGSLLKTLRGLRVDARLCMPLYRGIRERFPLEDTGARISVPVGRRHYASRIFSYKGQAYFIECDEFFDREEIYGTPYGEYEDNAQRFIFFSRGVLEASRALDFVPDVLHCNDWQTGLVPLYAKTLYRKHFGSASTLMTIHNIGYQGVFPASAMPLTGLDMKLFNPEVMEFYGQMNFLKAGIVSAGAVSTVSENYAREIKDRQYGLGLEGILRNREITGILNGIDFDEWDPARDAAIPANYAAGDMGGKRKCRESLSRELFGGRLKPLICMVGRLSSQKGIDIFLEAADRIASLGVNIVVLGRGEETLHRMLREVSKRRHDSVSLHVGYDEELARRIYAGSDILLMPSRYEPCGLAQMIAMRYGTVPVARATGGLVDTVRDYDHLKCEGTGFLFSEYGASSLEECLKRAICVYTGAGRWKKLVLECMGQDFSWKSSARKYMSLYGSLAGLSARAGA
jgi:starch synthase